LISSETRVLSWKYTYFSPVEARLGGEKARETGRDFHDTSGSRGPGGKEENIAWDDNLGPDEALDKGLGGERVGGRIACSVPNLKHTPGERGEFSYVDKA